VGRCGGCGSTYDPKLWITIAYALTSVKKNPITPLTMSFEEIVSNHCRNIFHFFHVFSHPLIMLDFAIIHKLFIILVALKRPHAESC